MASAPTAPAPPKFNPIDLSSTYNNAVSADQLGFGLSDADLASRYPGLVAQNTTQLNNSVADLKNPLRDPTVQSDFLDQGIGAALNAYGGGSGAGLGYKGGASQGTVASTLSNLTSQKQSFDQANFANLLQLPTNQPRGFGLSGSDAANLSIANSTGLSASQQANYANQVNSANAQNAANSQNIQTGIGTSLAIASLIATIAV